jgi:hypothetical protein
VIDTWKGLQWERATAAIVGGFHGNVSICPKAEHGTDDLSRQK